MTKKRKSQASLCEVVGHDAGHVGVALRLEDHTLIGQQRLCGLVPPLRPQPVLLVGGIRAP